MISRTQGWTLGTLVVIAAGITTVLSAFDQIGLETPRPVWIDELEEFRQEYERREAWNTRTLITLTKNELKDVEWQIEEARAAGNVPEDLISRKVTLEQSLMWLERRLTQ